MSQKMRETWSDANDCAFRSEKVPHRASIRSLPEEPNFELSSHTGNHSRWMCQSPVSSPSGCDPHALDQLAQVRTQKVSVLLMNDVSRECYQCIHTLHTCCDCAASAPPAHSTLDTQGRFTYIITFKTCTTELITSRTVRTPEGSGLCCGLCLLTASTNSLSSPSPPLQRWTAQRSQ